MNLHEMSKSQDEIRLFPWIGDGWSQRSLIMFLSHIENKFTSWGVIWVLIRTYFDIVEKTRGATVTGCAPVVSFCCKGLY